MPPENKARVAGVVVGLTGLILVGAAIAANRSWVDHHFLPSFAISRDVQLRAVLGLRLILAILGLGLLTFVRPRIVRAMQQGRGRAVLGMSLSIALAIAAALATTEAVLRTQTWRATQERWDREPLRRRDPVLGWTFVPNHIGWSGGAGPRVRYVIDGLGYRVGDPHDRLDFDRPTILLAGESIFMGYGLPWQQTIAARLASLTGLQPANISVNAFATDQILMQLQRELPRFHRPAVVVILFSPLVFDRNLDLDRPHLDPRLHWHPALPPSLRIVELTRRVLRYRSRAAVEQGVVMTRAALSAAIAAAQSRGARALVVVPQYRPENSAERMVRQEVLDAAHIPYLHVILDPRWRIAEDRHPDARGAMAIARAIAAQLPPSAAAR